MTKADVNDILQLTITYAVLYGVPLLTAYLWLRCLWVILHKKSYDSVADYSSDLYWPFAFAFVLTILIIVVGSALWYQSLPDHPNVH